MKWVECDTVSRDNTLTKGESQHHVSLCLLSITMRQSLCVCVCRSVSQDAICRDRTRVSFGSLNLTTNMLSHRIEKDMLDHSSPPCRYGIRSVIHRDTHSLAHIHTHTRASQSFCTKRASLQTFKVYK